LKVWRTKLPRLKKHKREVQTGVKALPQQAFSNRDYVMPKELKVALAKAASHPVVLSIGSNVPENSLMK
jgi:hypothetical protein